MNVQTTTIPLVDRHVCAAIQYGQVHSDLCGDPASAEWRQLLHDCLDELLDKLAPNDAHALFYVGNPTSA